MIFVSFFHLKKINGVYFFKLTSKTYEMLLVFLKTCKLLFQNLHSCLVEKQKIFDFWWNMNYKDVIRMIACIISMLSIMGSSIILLSWILLKSGDFYIRQIIHYLAICDFVASTIFFIYAIMKLSDFEFSTLVNIILSLLLEYAVLASYFWIVCFAHYLYRL